MAEDDRSDEEGSASRDRQGGLGVYLCSRGVQPGAHAEAGGNSGWCRMSIRRSVPAHGESGQKGPQVELLSPVDSLFGCVYLQFGIKPVTDSIGTSPFSANC